MQVLSEQEEPQDNVEPTLCCRVASGAARPVADATKHACGWPSCNKTSSTTSLFGNLGETAPAAAARPQRRLPADEGTEAQVTANPLGAAQEDEWEEHRSKEHGNRVYWINTNTRESTWEKPRGLARDDDDDVM